MKKIQLIKLISGSLKAKIITGVVATTIVTGGATTSIVIYNKNIAENQRIKQEKIAKEKEKEEIEIKEKEEATNSSVADKDTKIEGVTKDNEEEEIKAEEKIGEEAKATAIKEGKTEEEAVQVATKAIEVVKEKKKEVAKANASTAPVPVTDAHTETPAPTPTPVAAKPAPKPAENYDENIVVPGPLRNVYGGAYGENKANSGEVSCKNSITYNGKWQGSMNETLRKFSAGRFNDQDVKNIWLGKCIDGKYKVTNVRTVTTVIPWTGENVTPKFEAKGIWGERPSSNVHYDVTLVYGSNTPDFRGSRVVIDLQSIN